MSHGFPYHARMDRVGQLKLGRVGRANGGGVVFAPLSQRPSMVWQGRRLLLPSAIAAAGFTALFGVRGVRYWLAKMPLFADLQFHRSGHPWPKPLRAFPSLQVIAKGL